MINFKEFTKEDLVNVLEEQIKHGKTKIPDIENVILDKLTWFKAGRINEEFPKIEAEIEKLKKKKKLTLAEAKRGNALIAKHKKMVEFVLSLQVGKDA